MTLTELVHSDDTVVNVRSGEILSLRDASPEELAQAREGLVALRHEVDLAATLLDAELVARVDAAIRSGEIDKYTVLVGDYEVRVPSPEAGGKVNANTLRNDVLARADALGLTPEAIDRAFKIRGYQLNRPAYNTLAKQEPELSELLKRHTGPPERRRATVTPMPGRDAGTTIRAAGVIEGDEPPWET